MVGFLGDSGGQLTKTINMAVLKLVELGHRLFGGVGLRLTEGPPPTELSDHFWDEFVGDGFVDGF